MNKVIGFAKVTGFVALLAIMLVSAMPVPGSAASGAKLVSSDAEALAAARDCDGSDNTCFIRVADDGGITVYQLGKLLN